MLVVLVEGGRTGRYSGPLTELALDETEGIDDSGTCSSIGNSAGVDESLD